MILYLYKENLNSVVNKNQNHYYDNIFSEKCSNQLDKK